MMKKLGVLVFLLVVLASCNKTYEKAMKSKDSEFVLNAANQLYENGKWAYAVELYRKVSSSYAGTEHAENITFNTAMANFNDENYVLSAKQFRNFYVGFGRSEKAEEAFYMSSLSYYNGSPKYNLDQKNTRDAIQELQSFIDTYPTSSRVKEVNGYINELQEKLEKKAFEIAKAYYKTLKYKASSVSFANFLDDFPDSSLREEAFMYLLRSRSQLAINSIYSKKENRLKDAETTFRLFTKAYPSSEYTEESAKWLEKLEKSSLEHKELQEIIKKQQKNK